MKKGSAYRERYAGHTGGLVSLSLGNFIRDRFLFFKAIRKMVIKRLQS